MMLNIWQYRICIQFRHRWFVRPGRHMLLHDLRGDWWDADDVGWRELGGDRTVESNMLLANLVQTLATMVKPLCDKEPVHVARGTVCRLTISGPQPGLGADMPIKEVSSFAVCGWDPARNRREMFVKATGRRESLKKAIDDLGRWFPEVAGKLVELGLLDRVCPLPPPRQAYVRPRALPVVMPQDNSGDPPLEIKGELKAGAVVH